MACDIPLTWNIQEISSMCDFMPRFGWQFEELYFPSIGIGEINFAASFPPGTFCIHWPTLRQVVNVQGILTHIQSGSWQDIHLAATLDRVKSRDRPPVGLVRCICKDARSRGEEGTGTWTPVKLSVSNVHRGVCAVVVLPMAFRPEADS